MADAPEFQSLRALHAAYRAGRADPVAVAQQCLERARAAEPGLFTCLLEARALAEAQASRARWQAGQPLGPLDGVPVVWKDLFDVAGTPTTAASALRRHAPPAAQDAAAVAALCAAGAVSIGKTGLTEFAYSGLGLNPHFGTPRNRHSRDGHRAPGGSSSGSAVAVDAGMALIGMGTDTGGSVRIPAAFNGLVGFKPSIGRINSTGVFPLSATLDVIGPMARSVQDCAWTYQALLGLATPDLQPPPLNTLRLVVPTNVVLDEAQPGVLARFEAVLAQLRTAGARVEHLHIPAFDALQALTGPHGTIPAAEAYVLHRDIVDGPDAARLDPRVLARIQRGATMMASDLVILQQARARLMAQTRALLGDAWLLFPTVVHVAPLVAPLDADVALFNQTNLRTLRNTALLNVLDWGGVSLPMGQGEAGMPLGVLVSGPAGTEDALLGVAAALEALLAEG